jgi:hypothetical protein
MFAYPLAGNHLFNGHINGVGFYAVPVLRRLYHSFRKLGGDIPAPFILKLFSLVFRYMAPYDQIKYLPSCVSGVLPFPAR